MGKVIRIDFGKKETPREKADKDIERIKLAIEKLDAAYKGRSDVCT
jgi:hypothetical protein